MRSTIGFTLHSQSPSSPSCVLVEVAADPPEVELQARLRVGPAAPLDGVDVVGKVVAQDGGPLEETKFRQQVIEL